MQKKQFDKVTPLHDITWYVKWVSTILIILAVMCRSLELHLYDMMFSLLGVIGWTFVGLRWHDRALTVLNTILGVLLILGIGKSVTYSRYRKVLCMKKIDTRRDAWDRDYMGNHYQKPKPRTVNMNITPVYVFAMFFIAILVMVGNK